MCGSTALLSVLLAGLAAALASSSDLFDNQLGDINYCKKQCQLTIKNKSPAKVSCQFRHCHPPPFSPPSCIAVGRRAPLRKAAASATNWPLHLTVRGVRSHEKKTRKLGREYNKVINKLAAIGP